MLHEAMAPFGLARGVSMRGTTHPILTMNVLTVPVRFRAAAAFSLFSALLPIAALATPPRTVLPNGRVITPTGRQIETAPFPFSLAVRPDGQQVVAAAVGWPFSLNVIDDPTGVARYRRYPQGAKNDPAIEVHTGLAYSPDGRILYVSTGDSGKVDLYDTHTWRKLKTLRLDGAAAKAASFTADLALSPGGGTLYVLDQGNWRVAVFDLKSGRMVANLATGRNPFAIALSPDGHRLYVTNSGLFRYRRVPGVDPNHVLKIGLKFPAFGYPSPQAENGAEVEGRFIPGLGDPNSRAGSSVWCWDVSSPTHAHLLGKTRLGARIDDDGMGVVGGASPAGVVADARHVYVALSHEDQVAVLNAQATQVERLIALSPFQGAKFQDKAAHPLRGVMPMGLALHGRRLFVAETGINAVAVIDLGSGAVTGQIPTAWYPTAVAVSPDGKTLYVANAKGKGTGPNGGPGFHPGPEGTYVADLEFGLVSILPAPADDQLPAMTRQVIADNEAALEAARPLPRLRHVFLIIKENRTFDEVFGDLPGVNGAPGLARYGVNGWTPKRTRTHLDVTPNHHVLAKRFAISDNYYVDSDVSADGHRWVLGAAPDPWLETAWTTNYGGRRNVDLFSDAPGRRGLGGGSDSIMPEDEPEYGTLWEHIADAGLSIRNYGEGLEIEGSEEIAGSAPAGQRMVLNSPVPRPIFETTDRNYPTFNLGIPDQYRVAEFERDFKARYQYAALPALVVIRLPNDHTADPRPADGYPYRASYVADNDLALGKIVQIISHSRFWKDSAIFVTEDDAQGGVDHVDAHRSVLLAISPWVRVGAISHVHTSMSSIQKTIDELLGLGPLNLQDALSADLSDMFAMQPDVRPYQARPVDARVFVPARARLARPKTAAAAARLLDCDDPDDLRMQHRHAEGMKQDTPAKAAIKRR